MDIITAGTLFLRLVLLITEMVRERRQEGVGYLKATQDVLDWVHRRVAEADAERVSAADAHKANPGSDDGFDSDFRRD